MKPTRFTAHCIEKLRYLREWGFNVDEEVVVETVRHPQQVFPGYGNRLIAQKNLDDEHVLRVVYDESDEIVLVTLYPGRRGRYEA